MFRPKLQFYFILYFVLIEIFLLNKQFKHEIKWYEYFYWLIWNENKQARTLFDFESMFFSSHSVNSICQEVLSDQSDTNMRSDSEIESGEADPQFADSFIGNGLLHGIENVFIRELSIRVFLHFLYFCFCIIERQTDKGWQETRY